MTGRVCAAVLVCALAAPAAAEEGLDTLVRVDGSTVVGRIVQVYGGQYWLELADGTVLGIPLEEVARVERAGREPAPRAAAGRRVGLSATLGTSADARVRLRTGGRVLESVDARMIFTGVFTPNVYEAAWLGGPVLVFESTSPWHVQTGLLAGGELYNGAPSGLLSVGFLFDPPSLLAVQLGVLAGLAGRYPAVGPDLAVGLDW